MSASNCSANAISVDQRTLDSLDRAKIEDRHAREIRRGWSWNPARGDTVEAILASYTAEGGKIILEGPLSAVAVRGAVYAIELDVAGNPVETMIVP